ncbi:hypothetical protein FB451DRAFT_1388105 [Mycena latifolia]|nr:hypothetical protein FB451DRAFT_1388105 [Mycena latifolia]
MADVPKAKDKNRDRGDGDERSIPPFHTVASNCPHAWGTLEVLDFVLDHSTGEKDLSSFHALSLVRIVCLFDELLPRLATIPSTLTPTHRISKVVLSFTPLDSGDFKEVDAVLSALPAPHPRTIELEMSADEYYLTVDLLHRSSSRDMKLCAELTR